MELYNWKLLVEVDGIHACGLCEGGISPYRPSVIQYRQSISQTEVEYLHLPCLHAIDLVAERIGMDPDDVSDCTCTDNLEGLWPDDNPHMGNPDFPYYYQEWSALMEKLDLV